MTTLWSWRWTVARGWIWALERRCDATNADAWLKQYQADEPSVTFVLADRRPKPLREAA